VASGIAPRGLNQQFGEATPKFKIENRVDAYSVNVFTMSQRIKLTFQHAPFIRYF